VEPAIGFDGTQDRSTYVVSFPCKFEKGTLLAKDMTAVAQLELLKKLQSKWSDNSVSITVYYRKEELPDIKAWMAKNYAKYIKTVSFLLHNEHGFKQAPYEEIDEKRYNEIVKKMRPISTIQILNDGSIESMECASGACPIK
jgi:hypothetical protein